METILVNKPCSYSKITMTFRFFFSDIWCYSYSLIIYCIQISALMPHIIFFFMFENWSMKTASATKPSHPPLWIKAKTQQNMMHIFLHYSIMSHQFNSHLVIQTNFILKDHVLCRSVLLFDMFMNYLYWISSLGLWQFMSHDTRASLMLNSSVIYHGTYFMI